MNKSTEWVTVPREPTEAMMSVIGGTTLQAKIWKAMLAAAPTPPSADSAQDVGELVEALEPFAEVANWAERNGHDLVKDFDMLLRGPGTHIAGHLHAQSRDFVRARDLVAAYKRSTTDGKS